MRLNFSEKLEKSLLRYVPPSTAWCWKRDCADYSRIIYYKPIYKFDKDRIVLKNVDFFYQHSGPSDVISVLQEQLTPKIRSAMVVDHVANSDFISTLTISSREKSEESESIIRRLCTQSPRKVIPTGRFPKPLKRPYVLEAPISIYAGSGVSYEAGLPTLANIHEYFFVDSMSENSFTFGLDDLIPAILSTDPDRFFIEAFRFYIDAARADCSLGHRYIAKLQEKGAVSEIFTDNIDMLFEKAGAVATRVRTVFPHDRGVQFSNSNVLVVIGVAADRRGIIAAARRNGLSIVCVNPNQAVSPRAQNLSYLCEQDDWYCMTASEFLTGYLVLGQKYV